ASRWSGGDAGMGTHHLLVERFLATGNLVPLKAAGPFPAYRAAAPQRFLAGADERHHGGGIGRHVEGGNALAAALDGYFAHGPAVENDGGLGRGAGFQYDQAEGFAARRHADEPAVAQQASLGRAVHLSFPPDPAGQPEFSDQAAQALPVEATAGH